MTKIYNKPPSQTHKTTTNNTNTLFIRRAKFERLLQSSPQSDVVLSPESPLLIPKKYYPTNSPQLSDGDNDDNHPISPFNLQTLTLSPWISSLIPNHHTNKSKFHNSPCYLIGSLVREQGHVHSLAVRSGTLYTGSESNNIRIWRNFDDVGSLKAGSGFVKAISLSNSKTSSNSYRIFTGHQDGKIRVWTHDGKRVGTFPKLTDYIKNYSINKHCHLKHCDAVSCLSLNEELGLLYSGSWDKTINVWHVKDGKWLESINAHVDAINSIAVGFCGAVFSGGADGALKMWRRRGSTCAARHVHVRTLMEQENAVTSLAVATDDVLYCGSSDGLVRFWERESEKKLLEVVYGGVLRGHKLAVLCLATAGCMVFSGSADKSICVWRRERGEGGVHSCLAVLKGHSGPVKCLAVEPDRDPDHAEEENVDYDDDDQRRRWIVYSGSLDKSVRIWRVSEYMP